MLMNKQFLLAGAAVLASFANVQAQAEAIAPEGSDVVKLSSEDFESFLQANSLVLAEFFAPWCGHCKTLGPQYVDAASILKENDIPLVQVDCTENQDLCMEMGIKGYPSLKVIRNGDSAGAADYSGARTSEAIVAFMKKTSLPAVSVFQTADDLEDFVENQQTNPVVINYDSNEPLLNQTFYDVAEVLRDDYVFVALQQGGVDGAQITIKVPNQEEVAFNTSSIEDITNSTSVVKSLDDWIVIESKPYFGDVDASSYEGYMLAEMPLAYYFYTSEKHRSQVAPFFEKLGKQYRGVINFAGLDASKFGKHAENLNMLEQFPFFAIHDIVGGKKYGTEQYSAEEYVPGESKITLSEDDIEKFVTDFIAGSLEAIVKSEDIPLEQESSVVKIVGKTHDNIIYDSEKDVLVKYYAPWCGHCKKLVPIYEKLADIYAFDNSSNVVIGEIDATLNDVDSVEIEGFPTIVLYPAGSQSNPVVYSGPRSVESFITFISTNGKTAVDGFEILEKLRIAEEEFLAEEERLAEQAALEEGEEEYEEDDDEEIELDEL